MGKLFDNILAWGFMGTAIASVAMVAQTIMELNAIDWIKVFN